MAEPSTSSSSKQATFWARLRASNAAVCVALAGALTLMLGVVNWHYPITHWLFWRYLAVAGLALFWAVSCLSVGYFLLQKVAVTVADRRLEAALAFPLGVLAFQLSIFVLGLLSCLGVVVFVGLPAAFLVAGARPLIDRLRSLRRQLVPPQTFPHMAIVLFGVAGAALLYFEILSPELFHWDARWYHLPIAQQYALRGAIRPFPEGWWLGGYPHSGSLIYTWAFLMPRALLFDRLELCVHLEFVVFLATIASIPILVREFVPDLKARGTWAAIFLFPGIFLYDSNLCGAADHLAALWCIPVVLTLARLWRRWQVPEAILFGAFLGGGLASKLSFWSALIFPGLLFLGRALWLAAVGRLFRRDDRQRTRVGAGAPFLAAVGVVLLITAQYWLKNWIAYGDPVFPLLHEKFKTHPWSSEAETSYLLYKSFAFPPAAGWEGFKEALKAMFTFAFITNDWPVFHRNVPVFGFLFTLSMFCLPLVRATGALWLSYLGIMVSIVFWYLTTHQDRYLQAWLPVMVACTMATFGLVWRRRSLPVRGLLVALVGLQIVWGGDVPFLPTHNLINDSPIRLVSNFLASGFLHKPNRLRVFGDEALVGERLPRGAILLAHEATLQVGFGARTVMDQWQGRLSYAALGSPAAIYRELADMKVSHLAWLGHLSGWNSVGHDLAFLGFALNYGLNPQAVGGYTLAGFPQVPPPDTFNDRVAVLACTNPFASGFYRIGRMTTPQPGKAWASPDAKIGDVAAAVHQVGFLVVDPRCAPSLPPEVTTLFHPALTTGAGALQLYVRRQ